jgi:Fic family protein
MDSSSFRSSRAGILEPREARGIPYQAFVPTPLPPELRYDATRATALSAADAALGELAGVGRQLPNPHVLMAAYVRREAVFSSRIEGTQASMEDVYEDEVAHASASDDAPDIQEVRNYVTALEFGVTEVRQGREISLAFVLDLHRRLMAGVRGADKQPGAFRQHQNWIGHRGSTPATAAFVPPHPDRIPQALTEWERFLQGGSAAHPPLVACALLHQQFETIRPFADGNGRVGRLLIPLFLMEQKRLPLPLLYLSGYLEQNKREYGELLQDVRTDGAWEPWVDFFLRGVTETAREACARAKDIFDAYEVARDAVGANHNSVRLLRHLLENPFVSVSLAAGFLSVTLPTARKAIDDLRAAGIVTDAPKRGRTPLFVARHFLDILTQQT